MEEINGLTLKELIALVAKDIRIVLIITLVGLVLGCVAAGVNVASSVVSPSYTATMSLAIISENDSGGFSSGNLPGSEDVNASRNMAETAAYICGGDEVVGAAIKDLGLVGVDSGDVSGKLSATAKKDTQIIELSLTWGDPDEAVQILSSVANVVPDILIDTLKLGNASVVDKPKIQPSENGVKKSLMLVVVGLMAGAFAGVALVVLRDMLRPKVTDPMSVRATFGLKLLGAIPDDLSYKAHKKIQLEDDSANVGYQFHESFVASAHIISHHLRSALSSPNEEGEPAGAYREIDVVPKDKSDSKAESACDSQGKKGKKSKKSKKSKDQAKCQSQDETRSMPAPKRRAHVIYVTSSVEQEGKSTCVAQLAVNLAKEEWKTLLIDCDLRNPSLAPMLLGEVDPNHSVNAILSRETDPADAVVRLSESLHVLPAQLEEQRVFLDYRTAELCGSFVGDYDVILIDTPPMGQVSDALALNRLADECIFVIRYDYATNQMIQANLDTLRDSGANVLGAIVNMIDTRFAEIPRHYAKYSAKYSARYTSELKGDSCKAEAVKGESMCRDGQGESDPKGE